MVAEEKTMETLMSVTSSSEEAAPTAVPSDIKKVVVVLIQPTQYRDDGFPHRYWRVIVPSNSTAVMNALTIDAFRELQLPIETEIHLFEDRVYKHAAELRALYRRFPEEGSKLIVGFVGVQTGQFPRASDLIDRWQRVGATCVIGGPHVSGSISTMLDGVVDPRRPNIPCIGKMPAEIQDLMDRGVIVFHGEAEGTWPKVLQDILEGHPQQLYRGGQPDLTNVPLPVYPDEYLKRNFATVVHTVDACRGCPFVCSFCVVINAQGRTVRPRCPARIVAYVKAICERDGKASLFFVDDNFARNKRWEELLDGLIELRQQGYDVRFMIEADLQSYSTPRFLEKLAAAGCDQIFMGVESMNPLNLVQANKIQNKVEEYAQVWEKCLELDIMPHAGYMIGFDHDTPESVPFDIGELHRRGANFASFFMKTLLPGSEDHVRAVVAGVPIDPDFTKLDSFHATSPHPLMTKAQWEETYRQASPQFYSPENMITALKRCRSRKARLNLLRYFFWARWSHDAEQVHQMIAGFYCVRDYDDRRPGAEPLSYARFKAQEVARNLRYARRLLAEFLLFQRVMYEVDLAPIIAMKRQEFSGRVRGIGGWLRCTFGRGITREWLNGFWREYARKRWALLSPHMLHWHLGTIPHAISEVVYAIRRAVAIPHVIKTLTTE